MRRAGRVHGFSTLELLVAMAVVVVVSAQALGLFAAQQRNAAAQREVVEVQDDARLITDLMTNDVRMAGFMVPKMVAVSVVDGGTAGPDIFCVSDAGVIDPATLAGVTDRFGGASLTNDLGASSTSVALLAADMDIDGNGADDFAVGRGIIVSNGTRTHCARIVAIAGGTVTFTPATPAGFSIVATTGRAVPAIVYQVTFNWMLRNGQLFVNGAEDLQVRFGVDLDGDGAIGAGETDLDGLDNRPTDRVATVELAVIVRTQRADLGVSGGKREQLANRTAGAADTFRRRVLTNTIAPRNLM